MNRAQTIQLAGGIVGVSVLLGGYLFVQHYNAKADSEELAAVSDPASTPAQRCKKCEDEKCGKLRDGCTSPECKAVYECIAKTACVDKANEDYSKCYCGGVDKTECFVGQGKPSGPCKDVMEKGAQSTAALDVGQRFYDLSYPTGQAIQFANCRMSFCKDCP